ncbi:hypothetical protein [Mycobacterium hubeiense]|uniref:hypothetical protein n=1 Tax=Mycobacterium hubeiense TaxID=1867256 RepID=UPI000C7F6A65|nr:hypothetical protein [Mycobacterium sp. QGD 101]
MSSDNTPALPLPAWPSDDAAPVGLREPASALARAIARLVPWRYDRQLVAGVTPEPGSPLAVHVARLTSDTERRQLVEALRQAQREAENGPVMFTSRIPVDDAAVAEAAAAIDEVCVRLSAPRPVRAHGVARLRLLLSNGTGPLYQDGRGDLTAALRAVLAEL